MGDARKKNRETGTDRKFIVKLYPDAEDYDCADVLKRLSGQFTTWAYILHDKDVNPDTGELKKAHYHLLLGTGDSPYKIQTIANKLGISERYIQFCSSFKAQARYLVHIEDPEKYQYPHEDVTCNFRYERYFGVQEASVMGFAIINYLFETHCTNPYQLSCWCQEQGFYSEFRRGFGIWNTMMNFNKTND